MMTKKEYAENLLKEFCNEENVEKEDVILNPKKYIFKSSILAVALETLGVLNQYPSLLQYSSSRGGIYSTYIPKCINLNVNDGGIHCLSHREIISMLPDRIM